MNGLFHELRRRNVFKVAIVYAVVAWLVAQVVTLVEEPLRLPAWFDTAVIVLLIAGFPIALVVAWAFELTPQGPKRTVEDPSAIPEPDTGTDVPASTVPVSRETDGPSIAVLPFVNMSSDAEQEYFSDGIAEELLNQLAKVKGLHVAGRTSSFHFKGHTGDISEIASQLRVANVLEGSVRKSGNRVRVTAQLIEAVEGYHLWSETYDREMDDIFAIQDEIAHAVTNALSITLGVGDLKIGTRDVAAYDKYLEGKARYHSGAMEDWLAAVNILLDATRLDPDFLEAHVMLATAAIAAQSYVSEDRSDEFARIIEAATDRAMGISPDSVAVLCLQAWRELLHKRLIEADKLFERASRTSPNDATVLNHRGVFLGEMGRIRESLALMRGWVRVEPLYMQPTFATGLLAETAGDLDAAERHYRQAGRLEGDPDAYSGPELVVALTRGDRPAIEAGLERVLQYEIGLADHHELTLAMQSHLDDSEAALAVLRRQASEPDRLGAIGLGAVAVWASWFGDDDLALEVFENLKKRPVQNSWLVMWRPIHHRMRQLPGFKDLLRDLGLVDYWRGTGHWGDYVRPVSEDDFECIG